MLKKDGSVNAILIFPTRYSISNSIQAALEENGVVSSCLDYRSGLTTYEQNINTQIFRLPEKFRNHWDRYIFGKINTWFKSQIVSIDPDLILIYNNEMLLPSTLQWIKDKGIKIGFYLGDNPLYSATSRYNLAILDYADAIFAPDTFWIEQLQKMGLKNIRQFLLAIPEKQYYKIEGNAGDNKIAQQLEIVYAGISYHNSWGYKKARFMNQFTGFDLQLYGNKTWRRWFSFFPSLEAKFVLNNTYLPVETLNSMYNSAKIMPVDGNPGLMHGIHLRVLEALGSGILPLMEKQKDIESVFEGYANCATVSNYQEIPERTQHFLTNQTERENIILNMKSIYREKFNPAKNGKLILDTLIIR